MIEVKPVLGFDRRRAEGAASIFWIETGVSYAFF